MKWNPEQDAVLKQMSKFVRDPSRWVFRLWGKAGTGKTTLAAVIRDEFIDTMNWIALAYTGKAASRLRQKGWLNAGTMHSHMYIPSSQSRARIKEWEARRVDISYLLADAETDREQRAALNQEDEDLARKIALEEEEARRNPAFVLNQETDLPEYQVIVLDEVSMVGTKEGSDLEDICRNNGIKLILMGDPYQLPPVKQKAYFMDREPDFQLTQVMRQQENDPILHLAELARTRQRIPLGLYGSSKVVERISTDTEENEYHPDQLAEMIEADQLLVGTNDTRMFCNRHMRKARGYKDLLEVGEKLICLVNSKQGFFNGTMWYCQDIIEYDYDRDRVVVSLSSDDSTEEDRVAKIHLKSLRGEPMHFTELSGGEAMVTAQAVTVHKFQGSEGKHIVILDESWTAREDSHRWLYTAITRAQERLTLMVKR